MLSRLFGAAVRKIVLPLGGALASAGVTPNMLTVAGTAIVGVAAWVIAAGSYRSGGWILIAGSVFDVLDGAVARGGGKATKRGAFLDSTVDRLSDASVFTAVAWSQLAGGGRAIEAGGGISSELAAALALGALVLGFLTSYIKARSESLGIECNVGVAERPERILLIALGLVTGLAGPALVLLCLLSGITVVQRFAHTWSEARSAPK